MKTASIRILDHLWQKAKKEALSGGEDESVAFLTAKHFEMPDKIIFLAENLVPPKYTDYLNRGAFHLEVSPLYVNRVLNVAEDLKNTVIMVHSHPFEMGKPRYSITDDRGEALTSETISKCLGGNPPVGSLLIGQTLASARGWLGLSKKSIPASVTVLGKTTFQFHSHVDDRAGSREYSLVDRQVRAFGTSTQFLLESMQIGIVGLGGTGSAVAEQLVRMGVKNLILVDHDKFEPSNWSRIYGSTWKDTTHNHHKVDIVSEHLKRVNPTITLQGVKKSVLTSDVLKSLANCDIIFSCLDRHAPRAVLNELSYQCFIPVIDVGVGLQKDQHGVVGGSVRTTLIGPGFPCLLCQEIVRPEMITAENLSPSEYEARRAEGYVNNIGQNVPSVISYTSLAGSLGITMFLDYIAGHWADTYSTLISDLRTKQTLKLRSEIKDECVCKKRTGKGLSVPFSVAD